VAEFAAKRVAQPPDALLPQVIAYTCLGAAVASYEQWLRQDGSDLSTFLNEALRALGPGFQEHERRG
jgi:streptomycin 6-kinase